MWLTIRAGTSREGATVSDRASDFGRELLACAVDGTNSSEHPLRHVADLAPRHARAQSWPRWAESDVVAAFVERGITEPWSHQVAAADLAHSGRHVVLSTGTASGKSLAYQLPIASTLAADPRARALYLSPTKALGHDQLRAAQALTDAVARLSDVGPSAYDGDSSQEARRFTRERSRWIFSNPDMIHLSMLRNHARWAVFLRNLRFIVVDECHYYRGIFGSNVAMVLRRLMRLCARYGGDAPGPTVIFASATTASPAATASELLGQTVVEVTDDGSPQGGRTVALWEPALLADLIGENGAPVRRSAGAEAARVMADLMAEGARTLTFVRSRRGAELTALGARARLEDVAPELADLVASYRAGYLAEDRRALESALADGRLRGLATTNALELGVDIAGLDAVVLAGLPGHRRLVLAAGRPGGPAGPERVDRHDRARRPARHLPRQQSRRAPGQADRARRHRPREPVRARSPTTLRRNRTPSDRRRGADVERRSRCRVAGRRRAAAATARRLLPRAGRRPASCGGHPRVVGRTDRDPRDRHRPNARQHGRGPGARVGAPGRGLPAPGRELSGRLARLRGRHRVRAAGGSRIHDVGARRHRHRRHRAGRRVAPSGRSPSAWCRCRCRTPWSATSVADSTAR